MARPINLKQLFCKHDFMPYGGKPFSEQQYRTEMEIVFGLTNVMSKEARIKYDREHGGEMTKYIHDRIHKKVCKKCLLSA